MKNFFKFLGLALIIAIIAPAAKAERLPISADKLPAQAQLFLNEYYKGATVEKAWAKMMRPTSEPMYYRVNLNDGTKIQFSLDGNWQKINAKKSDSGITIDLLPNEPRAYITKNCPNEEIKEIKWKKDYYTVTMSSGVKLKFGKEYQALSKK